MFAAFDVRSETQRKIILDSRYESGVLGTASHGIVADRGEQQGVLSLSMGRLTSEELLTRKELQWSTRV